MRRRLAVLALLSIAALACAQPSAPTVPKLTLIQNLVRWAGNRPVPIVVVEPMPKLMEVPPLHLASGVPIRDALRGIAKATNAAETQTDGATNPEFTATQIGSVWTLSYGSIWVPRLPAVRPTSVDVYAQTSPGLLIEWTVKSLTAAELSKATSAGIPFSELSEEQRHLLKAAFLHPVTLMKESVGAHGDLTVESATAPSQPLGVEASVLHLHSVFGPVEYTLDDKSIQRAALRRPDQITASPTTAVADSDSPMRFIPHKEAASNLDYGLTALKHRIGLRGICRLGTVVAAAAKTSSLNLMVDVRLKEDEVFIGDASLTCGSVLRAITYDVNGAWRRIGRSWFLTGDISGREQRRLRWKEAGAPLRMAQDSLKQSLVRPDWFADAIELLRPEPGLNLGPTPEQIETLRKRWKSSSTNAQRTLVFADLNAEQRTAVLGATRGYQYYDPRDNVWKQVPEGRMEAGTLPTVDYIAYLDFPGVGRLKLSCGTPWIATPWDGPGIRPTPSPPPVVPAQGSIFLKPTVRALAIPPLPRTQWAELFREMKTKGIAILYVPVLWDGQTLHQSRCFPQLAIAHGADMLAELLRLAKARNIKVIGVVNALTWRLPGGSRDHWLAKRSDLVDEDALGRARREWRQGPAGSDSPESPYSEDFAAVTMDTNLLADFVTSRSGQVRSRLLALVRELRRYPGLSGIALRHWTAVTEERGLANWAPALGYTAAARVSFLREHGVDPVDLDEGSPDDTQVIEEPGNMRLTAEWESGRLKADVDLANTLLGAMRKGWPGHVHLFTQIEQYSPWTLAEAKRELPSGDINIPGKAPAFGGYVENGYAWTQAPGALPIRGRPTQNRNERLATFAGMLNRIGGVFVASDQPSYPGAVLDFTAAPDLLFEGLSLLKDENQRR